MADLERYWLVLPNGGRQLIDPRQFDLDRVAEQARRIGGRLIVERSATSSLPESSLVTITASASDVLPFSTPITDASGSSRTFDPPLSALGPLFKSRLGRIYVCQIPFEIDINTRPTVRVLGGYYKRRRLVRVYSHDRLLGRRSLVELFDTFLHEVAHHLEYTEPHSFKARACGRIHGRMHSPLFWRILGDLKRRWAENQRGEPEA